jgi:UDP-N-acetylmuramoyl-tripeptide--D-alanyl-D-alanine ligase
MWTRRIGVAICLLVGLVLGSCTAPKSVAPARPVQTESRGPVSHEQLAEAYKLGVAYLVAAQKPAGDFTYAYDWVANEVATGDNLVRQAGAAWMLAIAYERDPALAPAVERSLAFFDRDHGTTADGGRYVRVPGHVSDGIGAIALVALAELAYLRAGRGDLVEHAARLDGYIAFLLAARRPDGLLAGKYATDTGAHTGEPSPYGDGEALLALAMTARYRGRTDLRAPLAELAHAAVIGHAAETKSFYQWGTMALVELIGSGWPEFQPYAQTVFEMTDWELDVHRLVHRKSNVGYALEGLIPAAELARTLGDTARAHWYARAVERLLAKLLALQIGSATENAFIGGHTPEHRAVGGIQSAAEDPVLRIDVTQHQTHAVLQALAARDAREPLPVEQLDRVVAP